MLCLFQAFDLHSNVPHYRAAPDAAICRWDHVGHSWHVNGRSLFRQAINLQGSPELAHLPNPKPMQMPSLVWAKGYYWWLCIAPSASRLVTVAMLKNTRNRSTFFSSSFRIQEEATR
jgi:hypothetical protein